MVYYVSTLRSFINRGSLSIIYRKYVIIIMRKLILTLIILVFSSVSFGKSRIFCDKDYTDLRSFTRAEGFVVTSTTGGKHNTKSKHYRGLAIDVRTRNKTDLEIGLFAIKAELKGIVVKDERFRPKGQKVWGGPHLHLEIPLCSKKDLIFIDMIDSVVTPQREDNLS